MRYESQEFEEEEYSIFEEKSDEREQQFDHQSYEIIESEMCQQQKWDTFS